MLFKQYLVHQINMILANKSSVYTINIVRLNIRESIILERAKIDDDMMMMMIKEEVILVDIYY